MCKDNVEIPQWIINEIVNDYYTPKIKAEVIIDCLLTPFVCGLVKSVINTDNKIEMIAKEFPFLCRKFSNNTSLEDPKNYNSFNIDYLLCDSDTIYLVELKTDSNSIDSDQMDSYGRIIKTVSEKGASEILNKTDGYEAILIKKGIHLDCDNSKIKDNKKLKYLWQYEKSPFKLKKNIERLYSIKQIKLIYIIPKFKCANENNGNTYHITRKQNVRLKDNTMFEYECTYISLTDATSEGAFDAEKYYNEENNKNVYIKAKPYNWKQFCSLWSQIITQKDKMYK